MPSIGDYLLNMMGRTDPRATLAQAVAGGPPAAASTPAPAGTAPGMGAPTTPGTRPGEIRRGTDGQNYQYAETTGMAGASGPQGWIRVNEAETYKSPNELMNLYMQLQDRQERSAQINRGIGLMGASLAHPENRAGILATFNGGGGSGAPGNMINSLIDFQTKSAALSQKAAQRGSVPAIASQYGLDPTTALYLFDTGKLDSVIAELEKPDRQIVQDAKTGQSYIIDKSTGLPIGDPIGQPKDREIELVDDDVTGGKVAVYKDTKERVGKNDLPGAGNTEFEKNYQNALRERPELTREQFRRETNTTTQQTFVDSAGRSVGEPPKDMAWELDENGKVKLDERNVPIAKPIAGTEIDLKNKEAQKEAEEAAKVASGQKSMKEQTADIVTQDIDRALGIIEKSKDNWLPATGYGGLSAQVPLTPAYNVEELLKTVRANVGFDKLQAMRSASPTGASLGPVSDFENQLLQSTLGNLNLAQDPDVVRFNLKRIRRIYEGVISGEFVDPETKQPNQAAINKAYTDVQKDMPVDELLKIYNGDK